jgi:hypothetical protein
MDPFWSDQGAIKEDLYHIFPPLHKFFIYDLAGIILSSLDMYSLLDDSIGA